MPPLSLIGLLPEASSRPMNENFDIDPMLAWCEQEVVLIRKQIERLHSGEVQVRESNEFGQMADTTAENIAQLETKVAVLEDLLTDRRKALAAETET